MSKGNVCKLRRRIQAAIEKNIGNPEAAALLVCAELEDQLDLSGNGAFEDDNGDDDAAVFAAISAFYK